MHFFACAFLSVCVLAAGFDPNDYMDQQIRDEEETSGLQTALLKDLGSMQNASFQKVSRFHLNYCVCVCEKYLFVSR